MKLTKNIGRKDRLLRLCIALLLLACAIWKMSWILLAASLFVFFEAAMSWCVLYQFLGKSSCPVKAKQKKDRP